MPTTQGLTDLNDRLTTSLDDAKLFIRFAQACQASFNEKRYSPPSYQERNEVFFSHKSFTTAASQIQPLHKIGIKRYRPFKISKLIYQNSVQLKLPGCIQIHPVFHVKHAARLRRERPDTSSLQAEQSRPFIDKTGDLVLKIEKILGHRKRGQCFQLLMLYKGAPDHETKWKPLRDFVDDALLSQLLSTST